MQLVDWRVATATATTLVPPGPRLPLEQAVATVEHLRRLAAEADRHVRSFTLLDPPGDASAVAVVDRPGWIRSNVEGFRTLLDPMLETLAASRKVTLGPVVGAVGPRATGAEVGALLAYLATRVLGQFELLGPAPDETGEAGRLTLVAPNIVSTEQALGVDPHDFRLWVCLHEVTHRTQFAAAPWLHRHVRELLRSYLTASDLDPSAVIARFGDAVRGLVGAARNREDFSLVEMIQTPGQRAILDRLTGLMS